MWVSVFNLLNTCFCRLSSFLLENLQKKSRSCFSACLWHTVSMFVCWCELHWCEIITVIKPRLHAVIVSAGVWTLTGSWLVSALMFPQYHPGSNFPFPCSEKQHETFQMALKWKRGEERALVLIIYLTWEQRSEWNGPACCLFLLGSLRLHCFPVTSFSVLLYFCMGWGCSPQSMQIKSFDLCTFPAANGTLNLILLLWSCACTALRLTRSTGPAADVQEFITSSTICESNIWMKHLSHVRSE